jgi:hypothetical protein
MKESPQMKKNSDNMKPGKISLHGFLGNDTRNLIQIIIDDDAKVKRLNRSHELIAERMIYFRDKGAEGLGEFIDVDENYEVKVESVRGKMPSPFEEDRKIINKTNITVKNKKLSKEVTYTEMLIHLVASHGFYEGKGSSYRVNPEELIEVLDIPELDKD